MNVSDFLKVITPTVKTVNQGVITYSSLKNISLFQSKMWNFIWPKK